MESGGKPIQRIRTFADDFKVAKDKKSGDEPILAATNGAAVMEKEKITPPVPKKEETKMAPRSTAAPVNATPPVTEIKSEKIRLTLAPEPLKTEVSANKTLLSVDVGGVRSRDQESLLTSKERVFNVFDESEGVSEGSIITDQKRKRFKLLPAIAQALKDWFFEKKDEIEEIRVQKIERNKVVPSVKLREEVVTKAANKTMWAPRDDFSSLTKNIKASQSDTNKNEVPLTIRKPSEIEPPTWTHAKKEDGPAEIRGPEVEAEREASTVIVPEATPVIEPEVVPSTIPTSTEIRDIELPPTIVEPAPIDEQIAEVEGAVDSEDRGVSMDKEIEADIEVNPYTEAIETRAPTYTTAPEPVSLPIRTWARLIGVALLAILLGVVTTLWLFGGEENTALVDDQPSSLIKSDEAVPVALGNSSSELLRNLLSGRARPTSVFTQLYPEVNVAGSKGPASTEQILTVLDLRAPGTFVRNVTGINFGLYRNVEPFVILKTVSFDTAFGGMLSWESAMSSDLSPFFGAPVSGTFDPTDRSATQIREPFFKDVVVANLDARLLTDETQKERLIYAFLNKNTLVITTSQSALEAIINNAY